ncbi:Uncharacterised protein [Mycobacterium tuberculosis]|uniref:Uncharacterized protein n=1 Tax=Mycobacterium tuberculosis TaxID=1773 RepID=A0A0T9EE86_MYCTX|nr:Uncharacterised protein [Mycobacterium tuberculosis]CKR79645.1 Uncharacterised protein [Mycobacterium tuberculosis]CKT07490.1 Uncharacterised protein [Mycobacterium tuberculosis]CKT08963.1 Uncharacterised protein [Mycobacterium tuberculosis]COV39855.1 Uncharacterised protein [Mycobacterium tuberculosis]
MSLWGNSDEPPRVDDIDGVRWFSGMKEPLVSGHVAAFYGGCESFELFVVDIGEYRNVAQRGSRIGTTPLGPSSRGGHEMRLLASRPMPGLLTYTRSSSGLLTAVPDIVKSGPSFTFLSQATCSPTP